MFYKFCHCQAKRLSSFPCQNTAGKQFRLQGAADHFLLIPQGHCAFNRQGISHASPNQLASKICIAASSPQPIVIFPFTSAPCSMSSFSVLSTNARISSARRLSKIPSLCQSNFPCAQNPYFHSAYLRLKSFLSSYHILTCLPAFKSKKGERTNAIKKFYYFFA